MDTAELVPGVCARHVRHWTGGQAYRTPCCGPWSRQHRRRRMLHSRRGRRLSQPRCRHMYRHAPQSKLSSWSSGFPPAAPASDKHLSSYWPRLRQTGAARLETAGKQSNRFNQAGRHGAEHGVAEQEWEDRPPSDKLALLVSHLRGRHCHCIFCGVQVRVAMLELPPAAAPAGRIALSKVWAASQLLQSF